MEHSAMGYLIDASNLGGALGGRRGARAAEEVVRFLLPWAAGRGRVVAVFDGPPRGPIADRYGPLEVVWSGTASADDRIVALARREPKRWIVITADRELRRRCRDLGARVESPRDLAERIERPSEPARRAIAARDAGDKPAPTADEIAHWRATFGAGRSGEED